MSLQIPTLADVRRARTQIAPYLQPTALHSYPVLDEALGTTTLVKHENHQPTGAFKVRGGVNLMSQLGEEERSRGVIGASTGNHGQSVAYAAKLFDVPAIICAPEGANPVKVASMEAMGATVIQQGRDFDAAREHCETMAEEKGYRYVHSGNEPLLIAGVGTATLEILEEAPDIEVILVPIGGGSGAAGACIAAKSTNEDIKVIGVQSDAAPAAYKTWKARSLQVDEMNTFAEGLATRSAFELPQRIMWALLDDFVLVSDDDLRAAMVMMIEKTKNLVEAAGASPLAAALRYPDLIKNKKTVLMCTGGNVSPAQLRDVLSRSA